MPAKFRINLEAVEYYLRTVQKNFEHINDRLDMRREPMRDEIVENMLAGYRYVNTLLEQDLSMLEQSGLHHFLELNHIVLCGEDLKKRNDFQQHILATADRFYGQKEFCIKDLRTWAKGHKHVTSWKRAAGIYILHVSQPQLFFEGNHRTGALLMSSILVRGGKPPFVLTVDNAKAYFDPSSLAKATKKDLMGKLYKLPKIKKNFAKFLEAQANPELLIRPS
ncbi:MAG: hypothetical protein MI799_06885 [Desulfobacterales bacterium]|nr:hypothetical protein [Desulfobacterales bacterium]